MARGVDHNRRTVVCGLCAGVVKLMLPASVAAKGFSSRTQYIDSQVQEIKHIVLKGRYEHLLSNRYAAACVYYSDHFFSVIGQYQNQIDVPTKIFGRVCHLITCEFRQRAIAALEATTRSRAEISGRRLTTTESVPLSKFSFGQGLNHSDAADLFTREGSVVRAFTDGIVLIADTGWSAGDEFSSASMKGGNTVIIFNYLKNEFYRYAHLQSVYVSPGELVFAGSRLGTVGHTGKNAYLPGHGGHLHFEINHYDRNARRNVIVPAREIRRRLGNLI